MSWGPAYGLSVDHAMLHLKGVCILHCKYQLGQGGWWYCSDLLSHCWFFFFCSGVSIILTYFPCAWFYQLLKGLLKFPTIILDCLFLNAVSVCCLYFEALLSGTCTFFIVTHLCISGTVFCLEVYFIWY